MARADDIKRIRQKYRMLGRVLNEQTRRLWAAAESQAIGWGGVVQVSEATGLSRPSTLKIKPATFHGDWNYVIAPHLSD
jgi:hypothetical protein